MTQEMKSIQYSNGKSNIVIRKLVDEIEQYKQSIRDAKDALAAAEMELDAELDCHADGNVESGESR